VRDGAENRRCAEVASREVSSPLALWQRRNQRVSLQLVLSGAGSVFYSFARAKKSGRVTRCDQNQLISYDESL
jgi:hypothetical protein